MTRGKPKDGRKKPVAAQNGMEASAPPKAPSGAGPLPAPIPEELAPVWDDSIAAIFAGMKPQHQSFLLVYLREGNAAEAYRKTYNSMAKDHLAAVCGSQVLATTDIQSILAKFASYKTEALFTVLAGYREMAQATKPEWVEDKKGQWVNAGDAPDWQARKEALMGIRKVHGLDQPAEIKTTHTIQSLTDDQLDAKIAAALLQAGAIAPAGGEGAAKAHA